MEIIDSQVHILDADKPERPWDPNFGAGLGKAAAASKAHFTKGSALTTGDMMIDAMNKAGIDSALLVATSHYGWDNSYSLEAAEKYPGRFKVIGRINHKSNDLEHQMKTWRDNPFGAGLRLLILSDQIQENFMAGVYDSFLHHAQLMEIPVCIFPPNYLSTAGSLARRYKDLSFVIDHLGLTQPPLMIPDPDPFEKLPQLLVLADNPNISVKLSAVPTLSCTEYPFSDLWPHIHRVIDAFGPERVMWGSDWTRTDSLYSIEHGLRYITETNELNDNEKQLILGKTLRSIFKWND